MHQKSPAGEGGQGVVDDSTKTAITPDANDDAASSTAASAQDANQSEPDLEAVVRKAAKETSEDPEASSTDGKDGEGETPAAEGETDDAAKAEDAKVAKAEDPEAADEKLPFHKHPRWQEVKQERDGLKAKVEELSPRAEQFDQIGSFMREHELTPQEVTQGFEVMALMKHDPRRALEMLTPHLEKLELASGQRLTQDLQDRVDAGKLTPEDAQEIAQTRVEAAAARVALNRTERTVQTDRVASTANAMRTAVEGWENEVKATDPDYPHMQSFVADRARALLAANPPRTTDEAVALSKRAYEDVKAQMRRVLPQRTPVRTMTSDKSSSTAAVPVPSSLEDVVKQALRQ